MGCISICNILNRLIKHKQYKRLRDIKLTGEPKNEQLEWKIKYKPKVNRKN